METITNNFVEEIEKVVGSWPGVTLEPHRFGGREFQLHSTEIGHIHYNGLIDIPFSRAIREVLVKDGKAKPHHILPDTGWISFYSKKSPSSFEYAVKLLRLSFLFRLKRKLPPTELELKEELRSLNFGDEIDRLFL